LIWDTHSGDNMLGWNTVHLEKVQLFGGMYPLHFLGSKVSLARNDVAFPLCPLMLSESLSLFRWLYRSTFQARTGLYKIWFSKCGSLSLSPAAAGFLLRSLFYCEDVGYMLLRKFRLSLKYTASQPKIHLSSRAVFPWIMENRILVNTIIQSAYKFEFYFCVSLK
jgi:hypothetical protein